MTRRHALFAKITLWCAWLQWCNCSYLLLSYESDPSQFDRLMRIAAATYWFAAPLPGLAGLAWLLLRKPKGQA